MCWANGLLPESPKLFGFALNLVSFLTSAIDFVLVAFCLIYTKLPGFPIGLSFNFNGFYWVYELKFAIELGPGWHCASSEGVEPAF